MYKRQLLNSVRRLQNLSTPSTDKCNDKITVKDKKVPDLYSEVQDLLLEVVDLKQEVPDLRSDGIPHNLTPGRVWHGGVN